MPDMTSVLEEVRVERAYDSQDDSTAKEIKADFMTLGGGIILSVTILTTLFFIFALLVPKIDRLQLAIVAMLTGACWLYLVNRFSEKFKIGDGVLQYDSILARQKNFKLEEVTHLRLMSMGWSLSGDFYVLEIGVIGKQAPEQVGLGPCWNQRRLSSFVRSVGYMLEEENI